MSEFSAVNLHVVEPGWVDESWYHDGALQEMYVSLLGPEVWRNYRVLSLMEPLLLEVYNPQTWDELLAGFMNSLSIILKDARLGGASGVAAFIREQLNGLSLAQRRTYKKHGCLSLEVADFTNVLDDAWSEDGFLIRQFAAIMLTCMTNDNDPWFVNNVAAIWYDLCDITIVQTGQR